MNALAEIGNPIVADKLFDVLAKAKGTERDGAVAAIAAEFAREKDRR